MLEDGSWVAVKSSASPLLYAGYDPNLYHISALAIICSVSGRILLQHAMDFIRQSGGKEVRYGQDHLHFLPGVPLDAVDTMNLLLESGWQTKGTVEDFELYLDSWEDSEREDSEVRHLESKDVVNLQRFFEREFPNRWRYDVVSALQLEDRLDLVSVLIYEGAIEGFALIQSPPMARPIGGAVFSCNQGIPWGALGPIGVSERLRGRGLGDHLLRRSIKLLLDKGVQRVVVDWTHLREFYGKFGFVTSQSYAPMFFPW